ncbi:hypothetical protein VTJ83DRAFT_6146 [Remersonia thermophila]|uniref:Uncharacterized protein n=1 Tax=Remersonia thermophila TaxID=72144 RepID=A0ABR4D9T2_9PEZI
MYTPKDPAGKGNCAALGVHDAGPGLWNEQHGGCRRHHFHVFGGQTLFHSGPQGHGFSASLPIPESSKLT